MIRLLYLGVNIQHKRGTMKYPAWQRYTIAALCVYEATAIVAHDNSRVPTITYLQTKRHSVGVALVVTLAVHFVKASKA